MSHLLVAAYHFDYIEQLFVFINIEKEYTGVGYDLQEKINCFRQFLIIV